MDNNLTWYQFKSWESVYKNKPLNLNDFINHHWGEILSSEYDIAPGDDRWSDLKLALLDAEEAVNTNDTAMIASLFYRIGQIAEELKQKTTRSERVIIDEAGREALRKNNMAVFDKFGKKIRNKQAKIKGNKNGAAKSNSVKNIFADKVYEMYCDFYSDQNQTQAAKKMIPELKKWSHKELNYWPFSGDIENSIYRTLTRKIKKEQPLK